MAGPANKIMDNAGDNAISETNFDLIVIGAGINGSGIARDAALRGLKVLLLDKGDIGGGTSSWSTRLIHGGLRYLEHREFGLVRESLREREILFRLAPHLVRALPLLIPVYESSRRGLWTIRAGMLAYDVLSYDRSLPHHRMLTRAEARKRVPGLEATGLLGAALYYDAQVEYAERLVLENALSAIEEGAIVRTYARVNNFISDSTGIKWIEIEDVLSGQTCSVRGRMVINAAGPWVDQVARALGTTKVRTTPMIGGTKGSHLVVDAFPGAPATALYVEAQIDRRPFFIIPWNGLTLIGTTDLRFAGNLDTVQIDDQEIDYLLAETNRVIPTAQLTRASILFTYSGVRPLPFTSNDSESKITRRHFIHDHGPELKNFLSIVGGKLTTYRSLAQVAVDLVCRKLEIKAPPCTTQSKALPGGRVSDFAVFRKEFTGQANLAGNTTDHLLRVYGTRAPEVMQVAAADRSLLEVISPETGAIAAEVVFAFQHELARTLADCLLRRTMIGLSSSAGIGDGEKIARIAQQKLGWSTSRARAEIDNYRTLQSLRVTAKVAAEREF